MKDDCLNIENEFKQDLDAAGNNSPEIQMSVYKYLDPPESELGDMAPPDLESNVPELIFFIVNLE